MTTIDDEGRPKMGITNSYRINFSSISCRSKPTTKVRSIILFLILVAFSSSARASTTIPFVACKVDTQNRPVLTGKPIAVNFPKQIASELSLYAGGYQVALAPRGWICSATDGEAEDSLSIYPRLGIIDKPIVTAMSWSGDAASGIKVMIQYGGTYFPDIITKRDVQQFISESGSSQTVDQFLIASFLQDKIIYINKSELQFHSLAGRPGLGNIILDESFKFSTSGMMAISNKPDGGGIYFFAIRLPEQYAFLSRYIMQFQKNCYSSKNQNYCSDLASYVDQGN